MKKVTVGAVCGFTKAIVVSVCSPVIVIGMLVMEPLHLTKAKIARKKVHPV
jgi:hypothetical protein